MVPQRIRTTASRARPCSSSTAARTASMTGARSCIPSRTTSCTRTRRCAPSFVEGERCAEAGCEQRMALARGGFDVLRVVIEAADDDEVVDSAGDVELLVVHEAQVAGAEERTVVGIASVAHETSLRFFRDCASSPGRWIRRRPRPRRCGWTQLARRSRARRWPRRSEPTGAPQPTRCRALGCMVGQRQRRCSARAHRRGMRAPWRRFPTWVR